MANDVSSKTWTLSLAAGVDGTVMIAWSFVILAYFLHPAVESAYHRLRAYRAWRSIMKREVVEVTTYPLVAEVFGGRGLWDAARIIAVLLAAFSLASWGLELSMGLSSLEGEADMLNRPPPVFLRPETNDTNTDAWQVMTPTEINPGYDGDWRSLGDKNVEETKANSRYYIVKDTKRYLGDNNEDKFMNGDILVASWSTEPEEMPGLFYDTNGAEVDSLECSGETLKSATVYLGNVEWGTALDCERGPGLSDGRVTSPPAIILTDAATGEVSVVVEESSSYPSFLYSVWTAENADANELVYSFHLASTVRLAEAVVTGIVNGETSGGGCFGLLRMFSETRLPYEDELERASPFGEHPKGDTVDIQNLETIEAGVKIDMNALLCLVWVLVLTALGIAWSICIKSKIGVDVYDRDELLRAVSLQGQASEDPTVKHSSIRLFVRREDKGNLTVFINDAGGDKDKAGGGGWSWRRFLRLGGSNGAVTGADADGNADDPEADLRAAQLDDRFGGAVVPTEGTVSLGNSSGGTDRFMSASPVRSNAPSLAATPVHHHRGHGVRDETMFVSPVSSDDEDGFVQNARMT
eukprot:g16430.t1